jgi:hypothetical protein
MKELESLKSQAEALYARADREPNPALAEILRTSARQAMSDARRLKERQEKEGKVTQQQNSTTE